MTESLRNTSPESARASLDEADFIWHQRFDLIPGVETLGGRPIDYLLDLGGVPKELKVRSVLDIGTMPHSGVPIARFYRGGALAGDPSNWFAPTVACLEALCASAGLQAERKEDWDQSEGKRCLLVAQKTPDEPEFERISYEVPLRAGPAGR